MKCKKVVAVGLFIFLFVISGNAVLQRTLIDFSNYDQNIKSQYPTPAESYLTNIDGTPKVVLGYTDYLLENWRVELNSSANDIKNRVFSYSKPVTSQRFGTVLGVRVHFPNWNNNTYALIKPPFPIKIYDENGLYANSGNGVMPNVSEVKSISLWVSGKNYNYGIAIRLKDRNEEIHEFFMGWLYFDGWRKLVFNNPNFTDQIAAKTLTREPLYPYSIPYMVLDSIVIYRPADQLGGDFITYVKSIEMEYTPYIVDSDVTQDIKDEEVWGIITSKSKYRMELENKNLSENLYLYQQEKYRMQSQQDKTIPTTNSGGK